MFVYYNPNPVGRVVGDCVVRAASVALGITWEDAFARLAVAAFNMGDVISANSVLGAVLRENGFYRKSIPNECPQCYTFGEFARDNPQGVFVLGTGTHVATVKDGVIFDAWDSSAEIVQFIWYKPRKED